MAPSRYSSVQLFISFPQRNHYLLGRNQEKAALQREASSKGVENPQQEGPAPDSTGTAVSKKALLGLCPPEEHLAGAEPVWLVLIPCSSANSGDVQDGRAEKDGSCPVCCISVFPHGLESTWVLPAPMPVLFPQLLGLSLKASASRSG